MANDPNDQLFFEIRHNSPFVNLSLVNFPKILPVKNYPLKKKPFKTYLLEFTKRKTKWIKKNRKKVLTIGAIGLVIGIGVASYKLYKHLGCNNSKINIFPSFQRNPYTDAFKDFFQPTRQYFTKGDQQSLLDIRSNVTSCQFGSNSGVIVNQNLLYAHEEYLQHQNLSGEIPTIYLLKDSVSNVSQTINQNHPMHKQAALFVVNTQDPIDFLGQDREPVEASLKSAGASLFIIPNDSPHQNIIAVKEKSMDHISSQEYQRMEENQIVTYTSNLSIADKVLKPQTLILPSIFNNITVSNCKHTMISLGLPRENIKNVIICYPQFVTDEVLQEERENISFTNRPAKVSIVQNITDLMSRFQ